MKNANNKVGSPLRKFSLSIGKKIMTKDAEVQLAMMERGIVDGYAVSAI